jgi:hypothetical protein
MATASLSASVPVKHKWRLDFLLTADLFTNGTGAYMAVTKIAAVVATAAVGARYEMYFALYALDYFTHFVFEVQPPWRQGEARGEIPSSMTYCMTYSIRIVR